MADDRARRVERLYQMAVDLPRSEREAFLDLHCGEDSQVRAEVTTLLDHYSEARSGFMKRPIYGGAESHEIEERIGPYRPRDVLGEGGMGIVYLASQSEPLQRDVAIKVLKLGMDSQEILRRFDAERQALALMDHANIARVFDAGTTDQGRPFFAMEYVPGLPITDFCDNQRMRVAARLRLFADVCDAVQHAHQKGVIHRDLKPSNVLVTVKDGVPIPKVIDFGVAKAVGPRLTEQSVHTRLGQLIGTPDYMSPEQADLQVDDIDTRTDVYSLGVLLYQLLAGTLPHEPSALRRGGLAEMLKVIRTAVPSRPSERVRGLGPRAERVATARSTQPPALERRLRNDLDWIVLKAIDKDRSRRYGSPFELGAEVRRHLADETVVARPPTLGYRVGKFVRRHTLGVSVGGVAAVLLVAFLGALAVQNARIAEERDRANRQAATATRVTQYLTDLFRVSDPAQRGSEVTAREIMELGEARLDEALADQPVVHARLQATIGAVYTNLALYPRAEELLTEAVQRLAELSGAESEDALRAANAMGRLRQLQGRFSEAESTLTGTLDRATRVLGAEHELTLDAQHNLGTLYFELKELEKAERALVDVVAIRERKLGRSHPETMLALNDLGLVYFADLRLDEAERVFDEVLEEMRRTFGPAHLNTVFAIASLANVYHEQGRLDDAVALHRDAYEALRETLGNEHPSALRVGANLGMAYSIVGETARAESLLTGILAAERRVLGDEHPNTLAASHGLAGLLSDSGRCDEAEELYLEVLDAKRRTVGPENRETLTTLNNLAVNYVRQGRFEEAEQLLTETLETVRAVYPEGHPAVGMRIANLGVVKRNLGKYGEAEGLLRGALEVRVGSLGVDHPSTVKTVASLGATYRLMGDANRAEEFLRRAAEARNRLLGRSDPAAMRSTRSLASFYVEEARWSEAERVLTALLETQSHELGDEDPATQATLRELARVVEAQDRPEEASRILARTEGDDR